MVFAAILAGGRGSRLGANVPKQFLELSGKPILIHTIEKFIASELIDYIYISVNEMWCDHTKELIDQYYVKEIRDRIHIVCGGKERMISLLNTVDRIYEDFEIKADDIILSHDAVRPFVNSDIIENCIAETRKHEVAMASIPSADTTYSIDENGFLTETFDRKLLYVGQTRQGCYMSLMYEIIHSFTEEELLAMSGTSQMFINKGYPVKVSKGNIDNLKITTPIDIEISRLKLESK